MSSSSNKVLKRIREISELTGWNNSTDVMESVNTVLKSPNKVYFSDMAFFVILIQLPSSKGIGNKYVKYLFCQKLVHLLTHLKNLIETLIIVLELLSSFADSLILSNCFSFLCRDTCFV